MRAMFAALALLGLLAANPGMSPAAAQSYPNRNWFVGHSLARPAT